MRTRRQSINVSTVKTAAIAKQVDPSLLDINECLKSENTTVTTEFINKFQKNSLESVLFERLDSTRLSW